LLILLICRLVWCQAYLPTSLVQLLLGLLQLQLLLILLSLWLSHRCKHNTMPSNLYLLRYSCGFSYLSRHVTSKYVLLYFWLVPFFKNYNYDSGGLSSGWPWIKLIMLLVRWQLTLFWIMRSSHNCPLLRFLYLTLFILAVTIYCSSLWLFVDCEILQQRTIWSCEVRQIFKEWVHLCLKSWWKCHCRINVHKKNTNFSIWCYIVFIRLICWCVSLASWYVECALAL